MNFLSPLYGYQNRFEELVYQDIFHKDFYGFGPNRLIRKDGFLVAEHFRDGYSNVPLTALQPGGTKNWRTSSDYYIRSGASYSYIPGFYGDSDYSESFLLTQGLGGGLKDIGYIFENGSLTVSRDLNQQNRANTECLQGFTGMEVNIGSSLAEAIANGDKLALSVLRCKAGLSNIRKHTIPQLIKLYKANWRDIPVSSWPRRISSQYLSYIYGLVPFMSDVRGAYVEIQKHHARNDVWRIKSQRSVSDGYQNSTAESYFGRPTAVDAVATRVTKCVIHASLDRTLARRASEIGLSNPAEIAWELTRLSFIFDWFCPVGNYLNAITATNGLSFINGSLSTRADGRISYTQYRDNSRSGAPATTIVERKSLFRVAHRGFPAPMPYFKSPFSTDHALNASALIVANFG